MTHWPTLRAYVDGLDKAGKLVRITTPVNKDTELHPLVRLQFRGLPESQRKAFLFENVTDSKGRQYEMPVLIGALAASSEIYSMGMGVPVKEISNTWRKAMAKPLPPREVTEAACHQVVIQGDELTREGGGLSRLPIPISTPGFDNAPYTTASHWVSKNPDTGLHNLGNYRGQVKAENRIGTLPAMLGVGMREHIDLWRARGKDRMPAALVIGAPPHVSYTAVTRIPNDMCEYDVAGGLIGEPIDVVKCLTQDLFVPAESEIVIEGTVPTDLLEMEGAFGEFPGYMAARDYSFFMDVTAITMKKNPILLGIISQMPPSESSKMRHISRGEGAYKFLHNEGFTNVNQVEYLECAGANALVVIKMKKRHPDDAKDALRLLATKFIGKIAIAVDDDINPLDVENVMWAVSYRSQPFRDMEIVEAPLFALDPSVAAPGQARGLTHGAKPRSTALIIDATMPWPYPPLSLPKKQYMERAIEMWQELQLPSLNLKDPWWGYSLGNWTEEEEQEAELAVAGRHFETGAKQAQARRRFSE
jgi:4-hydroxy-3-polyprenylbenzoate decarboxylase